jgi:hypothetical protein
MDQLFLSALFYIEMIIMVSMLTNTLKAYIVRSRLLGLDVSACLEILLTN